MTEPMTPTREPRRIQRRRTKGWRMPEGAVYVGRPTKWGSPFRVGDYAALDDGALYPHATSFAVFYALPTGLHIERIRDAARTVRWYRAWFLASQIDRPYYGIADLRGKDLVCWCPLDQPCHADVLLELANHDSVSAAHDHDCKKVAEGLAASPLAEPWNEGGRHG